MVATVNHKLLHNLSEVLNVAVPNPLFGLLQVLWPLLFNVTLPVCIRDCVNVVMLQPVL